MRPHRPPEVHAEDLSERTVNEEMDWGTTRVPSMVTRELGSTRKIDDMLGRLTMLSWNRTRGWLPNSKSRRKAPGRDRFCQILLKLLEDRTVPSTITAGSGITFSTTSLTCTNAAVATFNVQGFGEPASNFSASIDWGDQSSPGQADAFKYTSSGMNQFVVRGSHTYAQTGNYSIIVSIQHQNESPVTAMTVGHIGTGQVLYVSNYGGNSISAIDSSGNVNSFANTHLNVPSGVALDAQGNVYVSNIGTNTIEEFSPSGQYLGAFATGLSVPTGLAFDAQGNLYSANYINGVVEKFSPSGQDLGPFAVDTYGTAGLSFDSQGNLFLCNEGSPNTSWVKEYSPSGQLLRTFSDGLVQPTDMCFDTQGNLYVLNYGGGNIVRFAPSGQFLGVFATTSVSNPLDGLAIDAAGNLYACEYLQGKIEKLDSSGHSLGYFASGLNGPDYIAFGAAPEANLAPNTNTSVTSSSPDDISTYGDSVTFTATVTNTSGSAAPLGDVEFFDGVTDLGPGTVGSSNGNSTSWTFTISALNAGSHDIQAVFTSPFDFNVSGSDVTQTVSPRLLHVDFTGLDKVYDGTTTANASYSDDALPSDMVGVTFSASFSDKNVGTGNAVNITDIAVSGGPVGNYVLASTTAATTASITLRPLTVMATGIDKVYDGNSAAAITLSDDRVSGDVLADSFTDANFADANTGTGKTITVNGISINGTDADNYSLQNTTAATAANITAVGVVISVTTYGVTYNGSSHIATGTAKGVGGVLLSGLDLSGTTHIAAGTYTDTWSFSDPTGNYTNSSGTVIDSIAPAGTSISMMSSANPALVGQSVTFTATVSNTSTSSVPNGTVTITDTTTNTVLASNVALDGAGGASVSTDALAAGSHTITAVYANADGNFVGGGSDTISETINAAASGSLSGLVFVDFNSDGQVDFGEQGIAGVTISLTGTDDQGNAISRSLTSDADGTYIFPNLPPGSYYITESQPAGYLQGIDAAGTAGGSVVATDQFFVRLAAGANGLNYNYGERPASTGAVNNGQTAGIGFWNNRNGQALIKSLNGGPASTQLADWLAATLPNTFGSLKGRSNADVAALFQQDFLMKGVKLDAQVLATALNVYATNPMLDSSGVAAQYGFTVTGAGVGTATFNIGTNGDAFGVANNTIMTVMDLLRATDTQTINGLIYYGNVTKRHQANTVYSAVNQAGGI